MTYNATDNHSEPTSHHNPSFTKKYCFNIWQEVKFKFAHCFPDNSWETFSKFPTLSVFLFLLLNYQKQVFQLTLILIRCFNQPKVLTNFH